jgi:hypothetical protein
MDKSLLLFIIWQMTLGNLKKDAQNYLNQYKSRDPASYAAAQQAIGGVLILDGFIGIDNPFGGKDRPGIFGSLVGIALGVVFLFAPTIFNHISGINDMTATTTATVVSVHQETSSSNDSGSSCSATAKYTVDGKEYNQASSFGSGYFCPLTPGSTIPINYNPNNPGAWGYKIKTISSFVKIFAWVGLFAIVMSSFTFIVRLLSIIFGWKLLKSGRNLAKTLPPGTDLGTIISEVKSDFTKTLFNFGGANMFAQPAPQPATPTPQPASPAPQSVQPVAPVVAPAAPVAPAAGTQVTPSEPPSTPTPPPADGTPPQQL